jgi:hypothetical protein
MNNRVKWSAAVAAVVVASVQGAAAEPPAELCFEFDGDELPSAHPDIEYGSHASRPEETVFAIGSGLLTMTLMPTGQATGYFYREYANEGGDFTPELPLLFEARLRVDDAVNLGGVWFGALDGAHDYLVAMSPNGVHIRIQGGWHAVPDVDVFDWHTYRVESPANDPTIRLYVDGELQATVTADPYTGLNAFRWGGGGGSEGGTADATWEYVRFSQAGGECWPSNPPTCADADINSDGLVDVSDFLHLIAEWGPCPGCPEDIDGDGVVNVIDFLLLVGNWGPCP